MEYTDQELEVVLGMCGQHIALATFLNSINSRIDSLPMMTETSNLATKTRQIMRERFEKQKAEEAKKKEIAEPK